MCVVMRTHVLLRDVGEELCLAVTGWCTHDVCFKDQLSGNVEGGVAEWLLPVVSKGFRTESVLAARTSTDKAE